MLTHPAVAAALLDDLAISFDFRTFWNEVDRLGAASALRRELLAQLDSGMLDSFPEHLLPLVFRVAGTEEMWDPLVAYVRQVHRPRRMRALVARKLQRHGGKRWSDERNKLPPGDYAIATEGLVAQLLSTIADPAWGMEDLDALEEVLGKQTERERNALLPQLDSLLERARLRPSTVWPSLVWVPNLAPYLPYFIDSFVREASQPAILYLNELRMGASDENIRRLAQKGYLTARSRSIEGKAERPSPPAPPRATGRLTQCLPDGSFIIEVRDDRDAGLIDGITLAFGDYGATVRGAPLFRQRPALVDKHLAKLGFDERYRFLEVPVVVIDELVKRLTLPDALPNRVQQALEYLPAYVDKSVESTMVVPDANATPEDYEELLTKHPVYSGWKLSEEVRALSTPGGERFFDSEQMGRIRTALEVNAVWHQYAGESREAALLMRALEDVERKKFDGPFPSLLRRWFLEKEGAIA